MMREEFDRNCSLTISDEDYEKVEFVYNYHPCNFDKVAIAKLVEEFGMVIIYDMLPRAHAAMEQEIEIRRLREELKRAEERLNDAISADMRGENIISWEV